MIKLKRGDYKMENRDGIERFISAHENMYQTALSEVRNGRKDSHWIWYIFPQLRGLGTSYNANYYGLQGVDEAKTFMENPVLNSHMREILNELLNLPTDDAVQIFGQLDALKLKSSMTIFNLAYPNDIFARVLDKFFNGKTDTRTLHLLGK